MTGEHKSFLFVTIIWHSLIVSQWLPRLMTSVGYDIVVVNTFHSWILHRGHYDGCRMSSRKCLPFRSTWLYKVSCCLVICVSLFNVIFLSFVFWVLIDPFVWLLGVYIYDTFITQLYILSPFVCVRHCPYLLNCHSWAIYIGQTRSFKKKKSK